MHAHGQFSIRHPPSYVKSMIHSSADSQTGLLRTLSDQNGSQNPLLVRGGNEFVICCVSIPITWIDDIEMVVVGCKRIEMNGCKTALTMASGTRNYLNSFSSLQMPVFDQTRVAAGGFVLLTS